MTTREELLACQECGMPVSVSEYHPYAACLMFKACHNSGTVRANLESVRRAIAAQPLLRTDPATVSNASVTQQSTENSGGLPELPPAEWFSEQLCIARNEWGEKHEDHWLETDEHHPDDWIGYFIRERLRTYAAQAVAGDANSRRYLYLRNRPLGPLSGSEFTEGLCVDMWSGDGSGEQMRGDELDAAIDAAIAEQGKQP